MERWIKWALDLVTVVGVVTTAIYTILLYAATVPPTQPVPSAVPVSAPGWLIGLALVTVVLLLIRWAPVLYRYFKPPPPDTIISGWPDAIRGRWIEDHSAVVPSAFIFYLKADIAARIGFGRIIVYAAAGGQRVERLPDGTFARSPDGALKAYPYLPHELWFTVDNKRLIRPENHPGPIDDIWLQYDHYFLKGVDCGGETIQEIKRAGNAFAFARAWK